MMGLSSASNIFLSTSGGGDRLVVTELVADEKRDDDEVGATPMDE